jgi:hypothetical protein
MYCIYNAWVQMANFLFAISLISLVISLVCSLVEIFKSTSALEVLLSEVEELSEEKFFDKVLHKKADEGKD